MRFASPSDHLNEIDIVDMVLAPVPRHVRGCVFCFSNSSLFLAVFARGRTVALALPLMARPHKDRC